MWVEWGHAHTLIVGWFGVVEPADNAFPLPYLTHLRPSQTHLMLSVSHPYQIEGVLPGVGQDPLLLV